MKARDALRAQRRTERREKTANALTLCTLRAIGHTREYATMTDTEIAARAGIDRRTLYRWRGSALFLRHENEATLQRIKAAAAGIRSAVAATSLLRELRGKREQRRRWREKAKERLNRQL